LRATYKQEVRDSSPRPPISTLTPMPDALVNPHVTASADERGLFREGYDLDGILTLTAPAA